MTSGLLSDPVAPVALPWADEPKFRCFGCSPRNPIGLALEMSIVGDDVVADIVFDERYASYPGVVHGGIVSAVVDEIMGDAIALRFGALVFSLTLRTKFLEPVRVGRPYRAVARADEPASGPFSAEADLLDESGAAVVMASGGFQRIRSSQAKHAMGLDDAELSRLASYFDEG